MAQFAPPPGLGLSDLDDYGIPVLVAGLQVGAESAVVERVRCRVVLDPLDVAVRSGLARLQAGDPSASFSFIRRRCHQINEKVKYLYK